MYVEMSIIFYYMKKLCTHRYTKKGEYVYLEKEGLSDKKEERTTRDWQKQTWILDMNI
jgi:hypothetical protein